VAAYQALRGVSFLVAATFVAEVGDVRRFTTPQQLMAFLGLVPSERTTGDMVRRGSMISRPWAPSPSGVLNRCIKSLRMQRSESASSVPISQRLLDLVAVVQLSSAQRAIAARERLRLHAG
jgi:hypothetical protein